MNIGACMIGDLIIPEKDTGRVLDIFIDGDPCGSIYEKTDEELNENMTNMIIESMRWVGYKL
jgi:hypothetical protein